jgi:hypothetical protein
MHEEPCGIVGQENAVEFLEDTDGRPAAKVDPAVQLMGLDLVVGDFDFSAFVVEHHQFGGREVLRVKQRGDQAMAFAVAGTLRIVERVFDYADGETLLVTAAVAPGRIDRRQVRTVTEGLQMFEHDVIGHAGEDLYSPSLSLEQREIPVKTETIASIQSA